MIPSLKCAVKMNLSGFKETNLVRFFFSLQSCPAVSLRTFLNDGIQVLYSMSLKIESLNCWPQFLSKSHNTLFLWPGEQMYFHKDQKIGWESEMARTICAEFFSVRRAPWRPLFIYHTDVHRATADKCKTMLCPLPDCQDTRCRPSAVLPAPPSLQASFRQTYGSHWGCLFPSDVQVTLTTGIYNGPKRSAFLSFGLFQVWGLWKVL